MLSLNNRSGLYFQKKIKNIEKFILFFKNKKILIKQKQKIFLKFFSNCLYIIIITYYLYTYINIIQILLGNFFLYIFCFFQFYN